MVKDNLIILLSLFPPICVKNGKAFLRHLWTLEGKGIYWNLGNHVSALLKVSE